MGVFLEGTFQFFGISKVLSVKFGDELIFVLPKHKVVISKTKWAHYPKEKRQSQSCYRTLSLHVQQKKSNALHLYIKSLFGRFFESFAYTKLDVIGEVERGSSSVVITGGELVKFL